MLFTQSAEINNLVALHSNNVTNEIKRQLAIHLADKIIEQYHDKSTVIFNYSTGTYVHTLELQIFTQESLNQYVRYLLKINKEFK